MAECYFKSLCKGQDVKVFSAGIGAGLGWRVAPEAQIIMAKYGLSLDGYTSKPLDDKMVEEADMLIVMTEMHRERILSRWPKSSNKIYLLREFDKTVPEDDLDVFDPVGCTEEIYEKCFDLMKNALDHLGEILCKK